MLSGPIRLVGGGKMGAALARGWLAAGLPPPALEIVEPDPDRRAVLAGLGPIRLARAPEDFDAAGPPRALVLAVKPQTMPAVLAQWRARTGRETLVLSIAAGIALSTLEAAFAPGVGIVRAMPNTPAAIGRGASVLVANRAATAEQRALAHELLAAVGEVHWIEDEELMHLVTALSGSGPAYVFYLVELLAETARELGLPAELARRLARATVSGAGELLRQSAAEPAELRAEVTSPGGTTAAALAVLAAPENWPRAVREALAAAARRSRELGTAATGDNRKR
ncbi:MAG: pyrroline-5-carboxylate reductase [Geminicoccaceae bacterium]|nr:pyrroline-5-carboxylate reductase [Geminicoccaceae bacterium]MDW8341537.1 pyrroline-5-carboxylate reductase [Geminicoccaceae bacterium]